MHPDSAVRPFLYLPVEVSSRELHAKLLLTHFAVAMGFEVVIGWKRMINNNLRYMPPGIVLFKTLTARDGRAMAQAHAAGHRIAAIDEEVPGLVATRQKLRWVAAEAVAASDLVFAVGAEHLEALRLFHPAHVARYRVVGNPRWDLLRPELRDSHAGEVAAIRRQYAPFILVNTNFAVLNSSQRTPAQIRTWFVKSGRIDPRKPEDAVFLDEVFAMERANTAAVRELLRALPERFPGHRIILRPHPVERAETWNEFLRDMPRALMVREGAAVPWIMASDVLVHTNCTTGVEAFALDKPAISLRPTALGVNEIYLANHVNYVAATVSEALETLDRLIGPGASWAAYPDAFKASFDRSFAGTHGPFASELVLDALKQAFASTMARRPQRPAWQPLPGYLRRARASKHQAQVMPAIDAIGVERILSGFGHALGAPQDLHVEPCGQRMFHVHGAVERATHALPGELGAWWQRLWPRRPSPAAA